MAQLWLALTRRALCWHTPYTLYSPRIASVSVNAFITASSRNLHRYKARSSFCNVRDVIPCRNFSIPRRKYLKLQSHKFGHDRLKRKRSLDILNTSFVNRNIYLPYGLYSWKFSTFSGMPLFCETENHFPLVQRGPPCWFSRGGLQVC